MDHYNPEKKPDKDEWLDLDEFERQILVETFHRNDNNQLEESGLKIHCSLHVVVENQIAEDAVPSVKKALKKLKSQGLDRHDSLHAIMAILSDELFKAMQGEKNEFPMKNYRKRLEKLTAARWQNGHY